MKLLLVIAFVSIPGSWATAPANASRAHYYLYPEPTPLQEVFTTAATATGWTGSSTTEYGWTTISPTNAGWPASSTTDYGGWASATPPPPGWSPPAPPPQTPGWSPPPSSPPPPPPQSGWSVPATPPVQTSGWAPPTPAPTPPPSGWTAPTPPPSGWSPPTPAPSGWSQPTPPPAGWAPPPPSGWAPPTNGWTPPLSTAVQPTPGWLAPGGCTTADCVSLENTIVTGIIASPHNLPQLRPPPYDNPTLVNVDVFVKNILAINDADKTWKVQLTLRQQWNDPRLAYNTQGCPNYKHFTLTTTSGIWTPDLFFPLEEEASYHEVPQRNVLVWIAPNGDVTYSTRLTVTMACRGRRTSTELVCPLIIGSYAYSSDKLRLQWLQPDPVQIDLNRVDLPNYTVGKVVTSGNGDPTTYLGQFPGVVAKFTFNRKLDVCMGKHSQGRMYDEL